MRIELEGEATAEVVHGGRLSWTPRLVLAGLGLQVGPYTSGEEHERHYLGTQGSGDWHEPPYDELLFNRDNGNLESLWFHIPEAASGGERGIAQWTALTPVDGCLHLLGGAPFELSPAVERSIAGDGSVLLGLRACAPQEVIDPVRLRVAASVDLLISGGRLAGWLVTEPERFLTASWAFPQPDPSDPELGHLIADYLALLADPRMDGIADEDPEVRELLTSLDQRIDRTSGATARREILHEALADLVEFYYD